MPPLTAISTDWQPSDALYQLLAQQNIPRDFIQDRVAGFVLYWAERGDKEHAWNSKFAKHIVHEWRHFEIEQAKVQAQTAAKKNIPPVKPITMDWRPKKMAVDHLLACGIQKSLIDECIVSFVMYWSERGEAHNTWNSKFVAHVKHRDSQLQAIANANGGKRIQSLADGLRDRDWVNTASPFALPDKR